MSMRTPASLALTAFLGLGASFPPAIAQGGYPEALLPVAATTRIVDRTGAEVFSKVQPVETDRFAAGRSADLLVSVPVATLAPGPHLMTVTVTHGAANAKQEVRFTIDGSSGG